MPDLFGVACVQLSLGPARSPHNKHGDGWLAGLGNFLDVFVWLGNFLWVKCNKQSVPLLIHFPEHQHFGNGTVVSGSDPLQSSLKSMSYISIYLCNTYIKYT